MKEGLTGGFLDVLAEDEIQKIHQASLKILQETGIYSGSNLVLDIFISGGARVDKSTRVIYLSPDMVEEALKTAPSSFVLHGRAPQMDMLLEPGRLYFGMGGSPEPFIWDYKLKGKRSPTVQDMVECTRLAEALQNIDFVGALCAAADKPQDLQLFYEYDILLRNTRKPLLYSAPGRRYMLRFLEMAAIASGGEEALRSRPSIALFTETVSPLKVGAYSEGVVDAAEFNVPIILALAPMMGATSPATQAGILAQGNAEALFGLVLTQMVKPGLPVLYGPGTGTFDMSTGQYTYGSPEQTLTRAAVAQLGRFYKLPTYNLGGGVEAMLPDAEAGAQAMMGILFNALSGITLTKTLGTMASGLYGSKEMLLICDEIVHMVRRLLGGIKVDDETLALDVINEVGHHGHFLDHQHTLLNFKSEFFIPKLFRRRSVKSWEEAGKSSIMDTAHEKVRQILEKAGPVELPGSADAALNDVLMKEAVR